MDVPLGALADRRCAACSVPPATPLAQCAECHKYICESCMGAGGRMCAACEEEGDWDEAVLRDSQHTLPPPPAMAAAGLAMSPIKTRKLPKPVRTFPSDVRWMSNAETATCLLCDERFTLERRRHHCRHCLRVVCHSCSSNTALLVPDGGAHVHLLSVADEEYSVTAQGFSWRQFLVNWKEMLGAYDGSMVDLLEESDDEDGGGVRADEEDPEAFAKEERVCDECFVLLLRQHPDTMRELSESDPALAALVQRSEPKARPSRPATLAKAMSVRGMGGPETLRGSSERDLSTKLVRTLEVEFDEGPLGLALRAETVDPRSPLVVLRCVPGGQASRLGVLPGMLLITVDQDPLNGLSFDAATATLREAIPPIDCVFIQDVEQPGKKKKKRRKRRPQQQQQEYAADEEEDEDDGLDASSEDEAWEEEDDDDERLMPDDEAAEGDDDELGDLFPRERLPEKGIRLVDGADASAPRAWMSDRSSKFCLLCQRKFTLTNRRHHCRKCLRLVCHPCSERTLMLPLDSDMLSSAALVPQRVCDECFSADADERIDSALGHSKGRIGISEATVAFLDGSSETVTVTAATTVESLAATVAPQASVALMRATGEINGPRTRYVPVPGELRVVDVLEHWRVRGFDESRFVCPLTARGRAKAESVAPVGGAGAAGVVVTSRRTTISMSSRPSLFDPLSPPFGDEAARQQAPDSELMRELSELREKYALLQQICRKDSAQRKRARTETAALEAEAASGEASGEAERKDGGEDEALIPDDDEDGEGETAAAAEAEAEADEDDEDEDDDDDDESVVAGEPGEHQQQPTTVGAGAGLLVQGWLMKKGKINTNWKQRYCVLDGSKRTFAYYKAEHSTRAKGVVDMQRAVEVRRSHDSSAPANTIEIVLGKRTYTVCAASDGSAQDWLEALQRCAGSGDAVLEPLHQAIPSARINEMLLLPRTLAEVVQMMRHPETGLDIRSRAYHGQTYETCFRGNDAVDWMLLNIPHLVSTRGEAVQFGQSLVAAQLLKHVLAMHDFKDEPLFYELTTTTRKREALSMDLLLELNDVFDSFDDMFSRVPDDPRKLATSYAMLVAMQSLYRNVLHYGLEWNQRFKEGLFAKLCACARPPVSRADVMSMVVALIEREGLVEDAQQALRTWLTTHYAVRPVEELDEDGSALSAMLGDADALMTLLRDVHDSVVPLFPASWDALGLYAGAGLELIRSGVAAYFSSNPDPGMEEIITLCNFAHRLKATMEQLGVTTLSQRFQRVDERLRTAVLNHQRRLLGQWVGNIVRSDASAVGEVDLTATPLVSPAPEDVMRCLRQQLSLVTQRLADAAGVMEHLCNVLLECTGAYVEAKRAELAPESLQLPTVCVIVNNLERYAELLAGLEDEVLPQLGVEVTEAISDTIGQHTQRTMSSAVLGAQRAAELVVQDVESELVTQLFSASWLESTHITECTTATFDDYFADLRAWLASDYALMKLMRECLHRFVLLYCNRLLNLQPGAGVVVRHETEAGLFRSRIGDDVEVLERFFLGFEDQLPPRLVVRQLKPMRLIDQLLLRPSDALPSLMEDLAPVFGADAAYVVVCALGHRPEVSVQDKERVVRACRAVEVGAVEPDFGLTLLRKEARMKALTPER